MQRISFGEEVDFVSTVSTISNSYGTAGHYCIAHYTDSLFKSRKHYKSANVGPGKHWNKPSEN